MNNVELINSYLLQSSIVSSYAAVKSNNQIQKLDQDRRDVLVKQIKSLNDKISKTSSKNKKKIEKLQRKISKKQSQITKIDNKKYVNVFGSVQTMRNYVSQQWKLKNGKELKTENPITKEELKKRRSGDVYVIGEKNHVGNRFIRLMPDLKTLEVCFDRGKKSKSHPMLLELDVNGKNYEEILKNLYVMQQNNKIAITYTITDSEVHISYDEKDYA